MSFKPEVQTIGDSKFYGNALAFATFDEAYHNARDLSQRWMLVTDYRAVESDEPVTHTYVDGVLSDYVPAKEPDYEVLHEFVRQLAEEEGEGVEPEVDVIIYRARALMKRTK